MLPSAPQVGGPVVLREPNNRCNHPSYVARVRSRSGLAAAWTAGVAVVWRGRRLRCQGVAGGTTAKTKQSSSVSSSASASRFSTKEKKSTRSSGSPKKNLVLNFDLVAS